MKCLRCGLTKYGGSYPACGDLERFAGFDYRPLHAELRDRHNAMLADQAAEAINDFRVALAYLCLTPELDPFYQPVHLLLARAATPYQRLIRGLR